MFTKRLCGILVLSLMIALAPARAAYAAAFTVNSTADTNDGNCTKANCTLREAISAAMVGAAADTITFNVDGVIALGSQLPSITSAGGALTIDATGRNIDINGDESVRPFAVLSGASLSLKNLTVTKGYTDVNYGGGVWNEGTLTVTNCTFNFNYALYSGGAIYNTGTMTITNSNFYDNNVGLYSGGAIWNKEGATATITGSNFLLNWAENGGAIDNDGTLTVTGSNFWGNRGASSGGGAITSENDMYVYNSNFSYNTSSNKGGAIYIDDDMAGIHNSTFDHNEANYGGGVYHEGDSIGVYNSEFSHNEVTLDGGGFYGSGNNVEIEKTVFASNSANRDGGGLYYSSEDEAYITGCTFSENDAEGDGGGIYYSGANGADITGCTFIGNVADGDGGGIWVYGGDTDSRIYITNSTFSANQASDQGGGIYSEGYQELVNCTISGNQALSGGGIYSSTNVQFSSRVKNTILADSLAGGNCDWGIHYLSYNRGNNIDDGTTCGWHSYDGSMSDTDPKLDILRSNGGPTQTMRLLAGSSAINGVVYEAPNDCPDTDQRGYTRLLGNYRDIGAFELVYMNFLPIVTRE